MYWLTPFKYMLEGFLGLLLGGLPIKCSEKELAIFSPPPGQSCESYAGDFVRQSTGYMQIMDNGMCGFCQYADGTAYAASFNVFPKYIWRDFGIVWVYIIFNFAVVFACSWLYLGGLQKIKNFFNPKAREAKKEAARRNKGDAA